MEKTSFECLLCGKEVEAVRFDEIGEKIVFEDGAVYECKSEGDLGWWDTECFHCDMFYTDKMVNDIMDGNIMGWAISLLDAQDENEMLNFVRSLKRCPAAVNVMREIVADRETEVVVTARIPKRVLREIAEEQAN